MKQLTHTIEHKLVDEDKHLIKTGTENVENVVLSCFFLPSFTHISIKPKLF